jgi:uncharacterized membrane protein YeiB
VTTFPTNLQPDFTKADFTKTGSPRLLGLDLARFLAFVGMVLVNFRLTASAAAGPDSPQWLLDFHLLLEGRAAALFVLLAGLGIGLGFARSDSLSQSRTSLLKRGGVLFAFGLLNSLIFEPDILHYYGVYFMAAAFLLPLGKKGLLGLAFALILAFPLALLIVDYDAGWDWESLTYTEFWSPTGFVRNLFVNGFHPVMPWLAFLLFGMAVSRLNLMSVTTRLRILGAGFALWLASNFFAQMGADIAALPDIQQDEELQALLSLLFGRDAIPPGPLYMLSSTGTALMALVLCLWLGDWLGQTRILRPLLLTGRQALTLYIAHIVIGMGLMEALGWIDTASNAATNPSLTVVTLYALGFIAACCLYAVLWRFVAKRGPLEALLRRLAG